jgi:hypothetical protein
MIVSLSGVLLHFAGVNAEVHGIDTAESFDCLCESAIDSETGCPSDRLNERPDIDNSTKFLAWKR